MMNAKNRRVWSLLLSLVMLVGVAAIVGAVFAPKAEAATAGKYTWRVVVNSEHGCDGWNDEYLRVYGRKTNGTANETSSTIASKDDWNIDFDGWRYNTFGTSNDDIGYTTDEFPSRIVYHYDFGGGMTWRELRFFMYLQIKNANGDWVNVPLRLSSSSVSNDLSIGSEGSGNDQRIQAKSSAFKAAKGTITYDATVRGGMPKASSISGGTNWQDYTLTANKKGGAAISTSTVYATVKDQYGVNWYQDPQWSITDDNWGSVTCTGGSGAGSSSASIPATSSTVAAKTFKLKASRGDASSSITVTVQPTYIINYDTTTNGGAANSYTAGTQVNTSTSSTKVNYKIPSGNKPATDDGWVFNGWATTTSATSGVIPDGSKTIEIDNYNDTVYATYKKTLTAKYHYYSASGAATKSITKDIYNHASSGVVTAQQVTDALGFTAGSTKVTMNGVEYTFQGWRTDTNASTGTGLSTNGQYTVQADDPTVDRYAVYTTSNTGHFYYYDNGSRLVKDETGDDVIVNAGKSDNATQASFTLPNVNPTTATVDGRTFTFIGWRADNANEALKNKNVGDVETRDFKKAGYNYYAVYSGDVTLSYNLNARFADGSDAVTGTVTPNKVTQYAVADAPQAQNAKRNAAEIAINPDGVSLTREGAEAFVGWSAIDGGADTELETATYAATGATMNITTDTVLTAVFRDSRKTVTFVKPDGTVIDTRTVRYNYGVNTTDSDFATPVSTISGVGSIPAIDPAAVAEHKDANNHYYFNGWTRNNDQNEFYGNVNDGFTFNRVKADVQFTASYTAQAHKWQQDDLATSSVSCNGEAGEAHAYVSGGYHRFCTVCEYGKNDTAPDFSGNTFVEIAAVDADYKMVLNNRPATCTAYGSTGKTVCKLCFKTLAEAESIEPNGVYNTAAKRWEHKLVQVTDPDRVPANANYTLWECSVCGHEERHYLADSHTLVFVAKRDATCDEEGYSRDHFVCNDADCGKLFADAEATEELEAFAVVIAPLGHDFQFALAKPATCTETGYEEGYVCARCGELQDPEKMTPATGHPEDKISTEKGFAPTCTAEGKEDYVVCTLCNTVLSGGDAIPATGHDMMNDVIVPTCTEAGKSYRVCKNAGCDTDPDTEGDQPYEEVFTVLPALGHDLVLKKGKAATCTEAGTKDCYECRRCALLYSDEAGENAIDLPETVAALGHDLTTATFPPTCTEAGYTLTTCSRCDYSERAEGAEALGHTGGTATCKDKAVCDVCGKPYGNYASHVWDAGTLTTEANCSTRAVTTYTCTVCGETKIEKGGYGDHVFVTRSFTSPTCTGQGVAVRECSVCGKTEETVTAPLGHDVKEWHLEGANAVGTCSRCGETVTEKPGNVGLTHICEKCGLIHEGRTGIFVQDGLYCKIIGFFRSIFKMFSR